MAGGVRAFWRGLPHKRAANWILMCLRTESADLARFMCRLPLQFPIAIAFLVPVPLANSLSLVIFRWGFIVGKHMPGMEFRVYSWGE